MRTLSGSTKIFVLNAFAIGAIFAVIAYAQTPSGKGTRNADSHGIRLKMGHRGKEALHCSEPSLDKALESVAPDAYKIRYKKNATDNRACRGKLKDPDADTDCGAKESGGAEPAASMIMPAGVHSTQTVTFQNLDDLKAFVDALQKE